MGPGVNRKIKWFGCRKWLLVGLSGLMFGCMTLGRPAVTPTAWPTPTALPLTATVARPTPEPTMTPAPTVTLIPTSTPPPAFAPSATPLPPTAIVAPPAAERVVVNVYIIIFDPEVNGQPLTQNEGFSDPHPLIEAFIRDIQEVSGGSVTYRIARESVYRGFPPKNDGFVFTPEPFWGCVIEQPSPRPLYCFQMVNYSQILNTVFDPTYMSACDAVAIDGMDEVWTFEGGWLGFWEFNTVTPGSLCPQVVTRRFTVMTFNYSREETMMLESLAHRVERQVQDGIGLALWDQFDGQRQRYAQVYGEPPAPDADHPEVDATATHCGNVHFPPNAYAHYQYNRRFPVQSDCDRWLNFPSEVPPRTVDCPEWGCTHYGYLKWWLSHIPHQAGLAESGLYRNWWRYLFTFD